MNLAAASLLCAALFVAPARPPLVLDEADVELAQLPGHEAARQAVQTIVEHRAWLREHGAIVPASERWAWHERMEDMDWRWDVWTDLLYAHGTCSPEYRRSLLEGLRRKLGEPAYYAGSMPPPVPAWLFGRID